MKLSLDSSVPYHRRRSGQPEFPADALYVKFPFPPESVLYEPLPKQQLYSDKSGKERPRLASLSALLSAFVYPRWRTLGLACGMAHQKPSFC